MNATEIAIAARKILDLSIVFYVKYFGLSTFESLCRKNGQTKKARTHTLFVFLRYRQTPLQSKQVKAHAVSVSINFYS